MATHTKGSAIYFVTNDIEITGELPIRITDGYVFRRARINEVDIFEAFLEQVLQANIGRGIDYRSRKLFFDGTTVDGTKMGMIDFSPLPETEWKYWVLAYERASMTNLEIEKMQTILRLFSILPESIDFACWTCFEESDQNGNITGFDMMIDEHTRDVYSIVNMSKVTQKLTSDYISSISTWLEKYYITEPDFDFIKNALVNFDVIRKLSDNISLKVVGLFSVIESLVSHKPDPKESNDSIGKQVQNKMTLLRKRYARKILKEDYFDEIGEEKTWSRLYSYRSAIAHGDKVDFNKKDFKPLRNNQAVVKFLVENVKELIILGLNDPEFLFDLRKC